MRSEQIKNQLEIVQGDITKLDCDCIVNAANRSLLGGGGIAEAFYGMPQKLRAESLKRLPEDLRAEYEVFRQNLERRMLHRRGGCATSSFCI